MKKHLALGFLAVLATQTVFADDTPPVTPSALDEISNDFLVSTTLDAEINIQGVHDASGSHARIGRDSFIALNHQLTDKIKVGLAVKLENLFKDNKLAIKDRDFKWQEFVKEAFIEIQDIGGTATAVIIGKQPIPFGDKQHLKEMPIFDQQDLLNIEDINEVFGIAVSLTDGLGGVFDRVDISAFESKAGDMEIGRIDSLSIRLAKKVAASTEITISHASIGHSKDENGKREERTVVGIITRSDDEKLTGWVHGIHLLNNPQFPNARYGVTIGAKWDVLPFARVVAEYSWLSDSFSEYGIGISADITKNTTLGVSARYRRNTETDVNEWLTGLELKVILSNDKYYLRPVSIFDNE
jgi:hypothetical protein